MASGVYAIVNTVNGKRYVGSAIDLHRRWREHQRRLVNGTHHNMALARAWAKYGKAALVFRPLLLCGPQELLEYEQRAIDILQPEYNICLTAGSMLGVRREPFSPEHRAALAKARANRPKEKRTTEQKLRMSIAQKASHAAGGRKSRPPVSEETRRRLSVASKGNTSGSFTKGLRRPPVAERTRKLLSEAMVRVWSDRRNQGDGACLHQD